MATPPHIGRGKYLCPPGLLLLIYVKLESGATFTKPGRFVAGADPEARRKRNDTAKQEPAVRVRQMLD
jgi:hypothetical protein